MGMNISYVVTYRPRNLVHSTAKKNCIKDDTLTPILLDLTLYGYRKISSFMQSPSALQQLSVVAG